MFSLSRSIVSIAALVSLAGWLLLTPRASWAETGPASAPSAMASIDPETKIGADAKSQPTNDEHAALSVALFDLAERVEDRLERVATATSRQAEEGMGTEVAAMHRYLVHLAGRAVLLGTESGRALQRKVAAIERRLANLEVALRVETPPPWRGEHRMDPVIDLWRGAEGGAPVNDDCADAPVVGEGTFLGETSQATQDGQATCGASLATADIWFEFVPDTYGTVWIDTVGSGYDAVLSVHQGCPGTIANQLRCSDDSIGMQASVSFYASTGQSYWVRVSGYDGATGPVQLNIGRGGSVSGTVTRTSDGQPIDDGSVCLYDDSPYVRACASVAADGSYSLTNRTPDTYWAVAEFINHLDELYDDVACAEGLGSAECSRELGTPLVLGATTELSTVDFALESGGSIEGVLIENSSGSPLDGAQVVLWDAGTDYTRNTSTNGQGIYRFEGLSAGSYRVYTSTSYQDEIWDDVPCNGSLYYSECEPLDGHPIEIAAGESIAGIDFGLDRLGAVMGTVTDEETGLPISSAEITLYHIEEGDYYESYTNNSGHFTDSGLPAGTYRARASGSYYQEGYYSEIYDGLDCTSGCDLTTMGTSFTVALNSTTSGIDFTLRPKGTIAGTVTRTLDGQVVTSGSVRVYDAGGWVASGSITSAGTYRVEGLDAGSYFVLATSYSYLDELHEDLPCEEGCDPASGTPVGVSASGTTTVDFVLDDGGTVTGTVTDAATGFPVGGVRIYLWDATGDPLGWVTTLSASGTFSKFDLVPGTYYASATHAGEHISQVYLGMDCAGEIPGDCDPTTGTPIEVTANTTTGGVDFVLRRGGGIAGNVRSAANGMAISYRTVTVWNSAGQVVAQESSASDGSYSLQGLAADTYTVSASGGSTYASQLWDGIDCPDGISSCDPTTGTPVVVPADTLVGGIDFTLASYGVVSGTVTDGLDQQPLSSVRIEVYRAPELYYVGSGYSDFEGQYSIQGLQPGSYYLFADPYDRVSEVYSDIWCSSIYSCDLESAIPIQGELGSETSGVDFELDAFSSLSGVIRDAADGIPLAGVQVRVWNATGSNYGSDTSDAAGRWTVTGVDPGTHYLTTRNTMGYLDQSHVGIPCFGGAPSGCDPTKGTAVEVASGAVMAGFDFELELFSSGVLGTVVDDQGQPLAGVAIDAWNSQGQYVEATVTTGNGTYRLNLSPGTYYISTDNGQGLVDEVWEDFPCPGSAFGGGCDPTQGRAVSLGSVGSANAVVIGIDFELAPPPPPFFADGFESGDTSAWSAVVEGGF